MQTSDSPSWRSHLEDIISLGRSQSKVRRLADLHIARKQHLGQFFTPVSLVKLMWSIARYAMTTASSGRLVHLLDNSVGTARMFHFALPSECTIAGVDVHEDVINAVTEAAEAAKFECKFASVGMQDVKLKGFDIALVNPPFSIHLEGPNLEPLPCTSFGRFGPNTAAVSDEYALCQALHAADVVIAVLPRTTVDDLLRGPVSFAGALAQRLSAVVDLPANAFAGEGANVRTAIAVFGADPASQVRRLSPDDLGEALPHLGLQLPTERGKPTFRVRGLSLQEPVITIPVTGRSEVRVVHSGRKLHLKTYCGLMQAKVYNRVLRSRVFSTPDLRLARGVKYDGQGMLDVQCLLASGDPLQALQTLTDTIQSAGGQPTVDPSVTNYIRRLQREAPRRLAPFGHWIASHVETRNIKAAAVKTLALDEGAWLAPVVRKGEVVDLVAVEGGWRVEKGGHQRVLGQDEAAAYFELSSRESRWIELHPPLQQGFPEVAASMSARAKQLGIDAWLSWRFQLEDLVEIAIKPGGAIVAWKQGLGKARLAAALILLLGFKHGLVTMPAYLVDEFGKRLQAAGLDRTLWQVIRSPSDLRTLRRINIISNERLRMEFGPRSPQSYAKALRHRVGIVVADEGEFLANSESQQSRALRCIAAKRYYVLTGTPMPNYPRDLLPLSTVAIGDAVSGQRYGRNRHVLSDGDVTSMATAERGIDVFRRDFVATEWVTNQWAESMSDGARREVPKVNNLGAYRHWLGAFIKRRLPDEPSVASCITIPTPGTRVHEIEWDQEHLGYYLRVADEFGEWFRQSRGDERLSNLMLLLARIGAVERACNVPQMESKSPWRHGLTSKQRAIVQRLEDLVSQGEKTVVFARNPENLELLAGQLTDRGIESVLFHGAIPTGRRNKDLDERFRYGKCQVLLASKGVTQSGLDLYQASTALFLDRSWSAKEEDQAARRLLRPQQQKAVTLEFFHLRGSIDTYQSQMVEWKQTAADSGLDWAAPMQADVGFLHLDHMLEAFVEDLAKLRGLKRHDLRSRLKELA